MANHNREELPQGLLPEDLHNNKEDEARRRGPTLTAAILAFRQRLQANRSNKCNGNTLDDTCDPSNTGTEEPIVPPTSAAAILADLSLLEPFPTSDHFPTEEVTADSCHGLLLKQKMAEKSEKPKTVPELVESIRSDLLPTPPLTRNNWVVRPRFAEIPMADESQKTTSSGSEDTRSLSSAVSSWTTPSTFVADSPDILELCKKAEYSSRSALSGSSTQSSTRRNSQIENSLTHTKRIPSARISATTLHLGYLRSKEIMVDMQTVDSSSSFISLEINSSRKELSLFASFPEAGYPKAKRSASRTHKLRTPLSNVLKIYETRKTGGAFALVVTLSNPPEISRQSKTNRWERVSNIPADLEQASASATTLHQVNQTDFGRWTVYRIVFPKQAEEDWVELCKSLGAFRVDIEKSSTMKSVHGSSSCLWKWLDESSSSKVQGSLALLENTTDFHLPFEVRYLLEVCISLGVLHESNIDVDFLSKLHGLSKTGKPTDPNRAAFMLEYIAIQGRRYWNPMEIFNDKNVTNYWPQRKVPEYCCVVRKATVTPTTIYFLPPSVETAHRLLRKHAHFSDSFLRVQFLDEAHKGKIFSKVWEVDEDNQTVIWDRILHTLRHGIRIGNRTYRFLAYGNSQLREHCAFFYCDEPSLTREMIWRLMGDFSHIRVAAKYAARMGQCLTTTREPRNLSFPANIVNIPDIKKNQWCFSDGVGKMGRHLADEISKRLKLARRGPPSAFQFRLGGSKGLVVVWNNIGWNEIHLRPSQIKFQALDRSFEVIKIARTTTATLNRQTIAILSHLGVPDAVFMDMLCTQLQEYKDAMENTMVAEKVLRGQSGENEIQVTMANMIANGFMSAQDPFMLALLSLWRTWSLHHLKHKGRLTAKNGAFVFGALDETGILRGHSTSGQGRALPQIFLQIPKGRQYHVVEGLCIVGRNPTLHPGDIRLVEAVDVSGLHHIHDVVIFPAQGDRDIPSMCSGGDLDGDEFFVIWDKSLVAIRQDEPCLETTHAAKDLGRDVTVDDVANFLVDFMKNDSIGVIAHAHLAMADKLGPGHPKCIELSNLHSKSVDFNKTGIPAKMGKELQVRRFPHFMGKSEDRSYHSDSVLGQIYDAVVEIDFQPNYTKPFDFRVLDAYSLDDKMIVSAEKIKTQYDKSLQAIMRQHSITTEFEVWTTFVLTKPVVGSDFKTQEKIGEVRAALIDQYAMVAYEEIGSREPAKVLPFVAACYRVTREQVQKALQELEVEEEEPTHENMPFISFPWIFEHELGMIVGPIPRLGKYESRGQKPGQATSMIHDADEEPVRATPADERKIEEGHTADPQADKATSLIQKASEELTQLTPNQNGEAEDLEERRSDDEDDGEGMDSLAAQFGQMSF